VLVGLDVLLFFFVLGLFWCFSLDVFVLFFCVVLFCLCFFGVFFEFGVVCFVCGFFAFGGFLGFFVFCFVVANPRQSSRHRQSIGAFLKFAAVSEIMWRTGFGGCAPAAGQFVPLDTGHGSVIVAFEEESIGEG